MPIMSFQFTRINIEKTSTITRDSKIEVRNNFNITNISQQKALVKGAGDLLKVEFKFNVDYSPKTGNILLEGHLLYLDHAKIIKEALEEWNKNKKLKQELLTKIINPALYRCNLKALTMSQEVNLPTHLPIVPKAVPKRNVEEYIG